MLVLGMLMDRARESLADEIADGLRPSHFRVIGMVPPAGVSVTELAQRVGMTKQGIGQFVAQLSEEGYLTVTVDPDDRRVRVVRRTSLGDDATDRLVDRLANLEQAWAAAIGPTRYRQFRKSLDELASLA